MTPEQLEQWCQENGISKEARVVRNDIRSLNPQQAAEVTTGKVLRAFDGVDDKLKMSKAEAVAKMQKGIAAYAERERQRMARANHQLKQPTTYDKLPVVELQDRVGMAGHGPLITLK